VFAVDYGFTEESSNEEDENYYLDARDESDDQWTDPMEEEVEHDDLPFPSRTLIQIPRKAPLATAETALNVTAHIMHINDNNNRSCDTCHV